MCDVDWALGREWVGTLAEVATAVIALIALLTWRRNLAGATKFRVAHKVDEEARLLRYFFYDARNGIIDPSEYPPEYHTVVDARTNSQEADGKAYVFNRRYKMVRRQILVLARLRARAAAALSEDVEQHIEELLRKSGELHGLMSHRVAQIRAGDDAVAQWPNQVWQQRVRMGAQMEDPRNHTDQFSQEFEQKLRALEDLLKNYK